MDYLVVVLTLFKEKENEVLIDVRDNSTRDWRDSLGLILSYARNPMLVPSR